MKLNITKIDLKQKLNSREMVIFMVTIFAVFLGIYKLWLGPNRQAIIDAKQQIQTMEAERSQLVLQLSLQKEKKLQEIKSKQWVGSPTAINQSIDALVHPINLRGVKVLSMQLSESQKELDMFMKNSVTLTLSGNFPALGHYIEYLENLPVPLLIESISIATDGRELSGVIIKIQGGLYAFN